jgi:hypothetical protein
MTTDYTALIERLERSMMNWQGLTLTLKTMHEAAAALRELQACRGEDSENIADLRAQFATIKAAAEDATEYVLALENKELRADNARLREALTWIAQGGNTITAGRNYVEVIEEHARAALALGSEVKP